MLEKTAGRQRTSKATPCAVPLAYARADRISSQGEANAALISLNLGYRDPLLRFFQRRTPDPDEAEDMVQEVFERLLRRGEVVGLSSLESYAFATAANVIKDRLRRRRARYACSHQPFDAECHGDVDVSPEQVLLFRERLTTASAALAELPARTRTIFLLRRLSGLCQGDIASQLGISISAVQKHMARARAHLDATIAECEQAM